MCTGLPATIGATHHVRTSPNVKCVLLRGPESAAAPAGRYSIVEWIDDSNQTLIVLKPCRSAEAVKFEFDVWPRPASHQVLPPNLPFQIQPRPRATAHVARAQNVLPARHIPFVLRAPFGSGKQSSSESIDGRERSTETYHRTPCVALLTRVMVTSSRTMPTMSVWRGGVRWIGVCLCVPLGGPLAHNSRVRRASRLVCRHCFPLPHHHLGELLGMSATSAYRHHTTSAVAFPTPPPGRQTGRRTWARHPTPRDHSLVCAHARAAGSRRRTFHVATSKPCTSSTLPSTSLRRCRTTTV